MSLPPFAIAAALAFWGWRSGHYGAAMALAVVTEAPRFIGLRFDLRHAEFARVADLCTLLFAGLLGTLFLTSEAPRTARAVLTTMLWLPALLVPVLLAQRYSMSGRFPLSGLFLYLRKLRARDPAYRERELDLGPLYFAICLLAAGIPNQRDAAFYVVLVLLIAWTLAAARPAHARMAPWAGSVLIAAIVGYGGQAGLSHAQTAFEDWVSDWILRGMASDPYRSSTDLGSVGRLKMIDAIVMRVYPEPAQASPPALLHRASFTTFEGATWTARRSPMSALAPEADGISWKLAPGRPRHRTRIFIRLEGGKALLALPAGTLQLAGMAAATVRRNTLGAVQAEFGGDWAPYTAESAAAPDEEYAAPTADDLQVARREEPTIRQLAAQLHLRELGPREALDRVRQHFATFQYATYRANPVARGSTAIADFILRSKSGHCEYFAAATTLLLRAAGIPARYATGFAVAEYSPLEQAYVVRARHAHAWTRAYVDGHWIDVDTTPPSWMEEEASAAPAWQNVADLFRWAQFRWSQAGSLELGIGWASILVLALVFFGWRLLRGKRAKAAEPASRGQRRFAGGDSEFYAIEAKLGARAGARAPHESIAAWLHRIEPALDATLREALATIQALHYRHRFDPRGLDGGERRALREHCLALDRRLESPHG